MLQRKTFWIDTGIFERLVAISKRDGLKISDLVRRAIVEFLKREEQND